MFVMAEDTEEGSTRMVRYFKNVFTNGKYFVIIIIYILLVVLNKGVVVYSRQ